MNASLLLIISILSTLPTNTQLEWRGEMVTPTELIREIEYMSTPKEEEKPLIEEQKAEVKEGEPVHWAPNFIPQANA